MLTYVWILKLFQADMMFGHFICSEVAGMSANTDKISTNTFKLKVSFKY